MGNHANISAKRWPKQGSMLNKTVEVCYQYNTSLTSRGRIVRDDAEEPWVTIISLENGRILLATECQYTPVDRELL